MRVYLPDGHDNSRVVIEPRDTSRSAVVTGSARTAAIREDDHGRYAGLGVDDARQVMERLEDEYGVAYDYETGRIQTDDGTPTEPEESNSDETEPAESDAYIDTSGEHWRTVSSEIEAGEYDDVLDMIDDDRESVQQAIEDRRDELE